MFKALICTLERYRSKAVGGVDRSGKFLLLLLNQILTTGLTTHILRFMNF